jgi:hypothetical protein
MEDGYHDELSTFKLGYDLTEIKSSSYYAEASEYIKKGSAISFNNTRRPREASHEIQ